MTTPPKGLPSDDQVAGELQDLCELLRAAEAAFADLKNVQADLKKLRAAVLENNQKITDLFGKAGVARSKEEIAVLRETVKQCQEALQTLEERQDAADADRKKVRDADRKEIRQALESAGEMTEQVQVGQEEMAETLAGLKEELARSRRAARFWLLLLFLFGLGQLAAVVYLLAFRGPG